MPASSTSGVLACMVSIARRVLVRLEWRPPLSRARCPTRLRRLNAYSFHVIARVYASDVGVLWKQFLAELKDPSAGRSR